MNGVRIWDAVNKEKEKVPAAWVEAHAVGIVLESGAEAESPTGVLTT